jgi:hypothetical protein
MMVFIRLFCLVAIGSGVSLIGCKKDEHPPRFQVTGKVLFPDGEPLRTGVVEFIPNRGNLTAHGVIDSDGKYQLSTIDSNDGACAGQYTVIVKQFVFYDKIPEQKHSHGGDVSAKFADERTTPLRFEVKAQDNEANFEVEYREKP